MHLPSRFALLPLFALLAGGLAAAESAKKKFAVPYGENAAAGQFLEVVGAKIYYEIYGSGQPLLLIHGNGDSIAALGHQIEEFSRRYRVIVADSRGHGRSDLGKGRLTYERQADDLNSLLAHLNVNAALVFGWSDGGILGLILAMQYPGRVAKLAIMGVSLNPDASEPWTEEWSRKRSALLERMLREGDRSQPWERLQRQFNLVSTQPQIPLSELAKVRVPTLVMAADKDLIRTEHTLQIFRALPQAHLAIFPGATHQVPRENAELVNRSVAQFFAAPFARPDTRDQFR